MSTTHSLTVLKLGGSLITHKDQRETVDWNSLDRACATIGTFLGDLPDEHRLIIVHGGGSFGHHNAAEHGVSSTEGSTDARALTAIHHAMGELNGAVLGGLHDHGIDALPVRPLSVAAQDGPLQFPTASVEAMLDEGFVPVTHGDVVVDDRKGGTILSGDDIVVSLARTLGADRVGLCSTVPGVLDDDDAVISQVDTYDDVASVLGGSDATDVTGGMAHKVRQLLALDAAAAIFALDDLSQFLEHGTAGTVISGHDEERSH
ncbi:isopentenyl phosphate kinase [Halovenus rubra]|uniref:Isopentenyl phosphate kinase n=2 Tax=Halovenus rubra TaxID=869890 RepID=A0ABD5XB66_9EURY|nr:isopentenyl phosphate kinase [Halovenus rubra]